MSQDLFQYLVIILTTGGGLAAVRAYVHSKEARALAEDLIHDLTEDLRTHIVIAASEAAQQVIEKLPKARLAKPATPPVAQ